MSIADEIEKLNNLRQNGAISDEEYRKAKNSLLNPKNEPDENTWSMFLHLSQFCGYIFPLAGIIVPIILWQIKKSESPFIDKNGRIVVNWVLTEIILFIIFGVLCLILIGIPLIAALIILGIVFPIIGGIKASNGEAWSYPFTIKFFAVE